MRRAALAPTLALLAAFAACDRGETELVGELTVTPPAVNFCYALAGEEHAWQGLQLVNDGDAPLVVTEIALRGDDGCAFRAFLEGAGTGSGEDIAVAEEGAPGEAVGLEIPAGGVRLLRVVFTPAAKERDDAALVIRAAADTLAADAPAERTVPVCGVGVDDLADVPKPEGDAGVPCEECEPPAAGAAGCES